MFCVESAMRLSPPFGDMRSLRRWSVTLLLRNRKDFSRGGGERAQPLRARASRRAAAAAAGSGAARTAPIRATPCAPAWGRAPRRPEGQGEGRVAVPDDGGPALLRQAHHPLAQLPAGPGREVLLAELD